MKKLIVLLIMLMPVCFGGEVTVDEKLIVNGNICVQGTTPYISIRDLEDDDAARISFDAVAGNNLNFSYGSQATSDPSDFVTSWEAFSASTSNVQMTCEGGSFLHLDDNVGFLGESIGLVQITLDSDANTENATFRIYKDGTGWGTGTILFTVGEDGKVGIGTAAPTHKLTVGNGATSAGVIAINEDTDDGTNNATFTVPALTADTDYILPPNDGDNTEVLQTNGSGTLTWVANAGGGGSGTYFKHFPVQSAKLTGADITASAGIDAGERGWMLTFDDTTEQSAVWQCAVDPNYAAGTLTLEILYKLASGQGATANVKWDIKVIAVTGNNSEAFNVDGYDTEQTVTDSVDSATADHVFLATRTFTQAEADGMAVDDVIRVHISRDVAVANDATGDGQIISLEWHE